MLKVQDGEDRSDLRGLAAMLLSELSVYDSAVLEEMICVVEYMCVRSH